MFPTVAQIVDTGLTLAERVFCRVARLLDTHRGRIAVDILLARMRVRNGYGDDFDRLSDLVASFPNFDPELLADSKNPVLAIPLRSAGASFATTGARGAIASMRQAVDAIEQRMQAHGADSIGTMSSGGQVIGLQVRDPSPCPECSSVEVIDDPARGLVCRGCRVKRGIS